MAFCITTLYVMIKDNKSQSISVCNEHKQSKSIDDLD